LSFGSESLIPEERPNDVYVSKFSSDNKGISFLKLVYEGGKFILKDQGAGGGLYIKI